MKSKGDIANSINPKKAQGVSPDGVPYKVLLVDDSMFVRKQLEQILLSEGFDVIASADNGYEGVEKYKELFPKIDLVTMDITMPVMDGITALEKIIEFDDEATIIMISALGKQDLVKKALVIGAKNYIVKPLDRGKVLERVLGAITD